MTDDPGEMELAESKRALIALSMIPGIGAGRIRKLISVVGSAQGVLESPAAVLSKIAGIGMQRAVSIAAFDGYESVDDQLQWADRAEASLIPYWDDQYPPLLASIYDPPAFLWVRGNIEALHARGIAIVGTRKPSPYGVRAAAHFAAGLAAQGLSVISGLAYGIDAAAHKAALEAGGASIAVLGSGIDRIYPAKHATLARNLTLQGAIVSELPLRAKPDGTNFPKRNRIISGLALGTLVVEAYEKGGALITARLAVEQNREVYAVPGSIFHESAMGCHKILQAGQAKLVHSLEDVLEELGVYLDDQTASNQKAAAAAKLGTVEKQIYAVLTDEPMLIDTICLKTGIDTSTALVYLLSLEFKGLVFQLAGKQFYRA